jgi:glycosyltransferase involved in cell wall biosynthesis
MSDRPAIAFASRELWPFVTGGGIGRTLHGTLRLLGDVADVTMITRDSFRERYEEMRAAGDPTLPHPRVRFEFVPEPHGFELGPFTSFMHCWSTRIYERLCELYPGGGPDLAVFGDYMGEGFVTIQARRAGLPSLRRTNIVVRLHTSLEMVDWLDGRTDPDEERRGIYTLERGSLAFADGLRAPADAVIQGYRRFYGEQCIAPGRAMRNTIAEREGGPTRPPPGGAVTRLLYIGRLQRLKGVADLVEAARRLERDDFELSLVGGDTDTGPGGGSMREHLLRIADGDPRIRFLGRVPLEQVLELIDEHHVVVTPSHWECWSAVAREALLRNRPVLAAPRGGLSDAVEPGKSGWLMEGANTDAVERGLRLVLDARAEVDAMIASGSPRRVLDSMLSSEVTISEYLALARERSAEPPPARARPAISAVVVCGPGSGSLSETLAALERQTVSVRERVVVAAGLERLARATRPPVDALTIAPADTERADLIAAGVARATGELVLLLDAGMRPEPLLVERLLEALRRNPNAAYATAWAHGLDPRSVPLGNFANRVFEHDSAAVAPLVRRELFEEFDPSLGSCAERVFYARLAAEERFGCVVPERLVRAAPFSRPCRDALRLVEELTTPAPPAHFP